MPMIVLLPFGFTVCFLSYVIRNTLCFDNWYSILQDSILVIKLKKCQPIYLTKLKARENKFNQIGRDSFGSYCTKYVSIFYTASGIPTSPSDDCEHYEVHINADIALALRQYIYLTGEVTDDLMKLSKGLAEYWVSRLSYLEDKKMYGILGEKANCNIVLHGHLVTW